MGSWLKKACRHLERERGLPGAQWPIRGPEKIGRLPPLSGTLQEACSCGEESMAPDLASCHLPGAEWGVGCGDLRPLCALLAPLPSSVPVGRTVSSGARLIHEGRTPTLASLSGALVPPPPAPRFSLRPGPPCPHLATHRIPSRGGGAGPLRLGCGGRPRAHVSVGRGCAARPPLAPSPRCRVRIASRRARSCQGRATPRRAGTRGARRGRGWGAPRPLCASVPVVANQSKANQSNRTRPCKEDF